MGTEVKANPVRVGQDTSRREHPDPAFLSHAVGRTKPPTLCLGLNSAFVSMSLPFIDALLQWDRHVPCCVEFAIKVFAARRFVYELWVACQPTAQFVPSSKANYASGCADYIEQNEKERVHIMIYSVLIIILCLYYNGQQQHFTLSECTCHNSYFIGKASLPAFPLGTLGNYYTNARRSTIVPCSP